jgi:hypothetical protein
MVDVGRRRLAAPVVHRARRPRVRDQLLRVHGRLGVDDACAGGPRGVGGADGGPGGVVAMAAALWREVAAEGGGGLGRGDALRRLEACAHVPARLVVAVASSLASAARVVGFRLTLPSPADIFCKPSARKPCETRTGAAYSSTSSHIDI